MGPAVSRPGSRARLFPPPSEEWPWGPPVLGSASRDVTGHSPVFRGSSLTGRWLCDRKKREEARPRGRLYHGLCSDSWGVPATHLAEAEAPDTPGPLSGPAPTERS